MSEFSIGEVAIVHGLTLCPEANGLEVTVLSAPHYALAMNRLGRISTAYGYEISGLEEFGMDFMAPEHLRKKRPPEQLSSWDVGVWRPEAMPA